MAGNSVAEAAAQLRADLQLLDASTKEAASLLDLAAWQLGELARMAAPMTARTVGLARAREAIQASRAQSEDVLAHLDASRKVQGVVEAGPRADPAAFLAALERLEAAIDFLQAHRSMHSAQDALRHTTALRDAALASAAAEFAAQLQKRAAAPAAAAAAGAPLPEPVVAQLRSLAAAMLRRGGSAAGGRACVQAYVGARCGALGAALEAHLPPQQASGGSKEEVARLPWEAVEPRIAGWTAALRLLVQLAQAEAQLCAAIFPAGEQGAVASQVVAAAASPLLEAAEVVLSVRRSPDKVPALLDMHAALEAAAAPLRAALAGGSRLQRASMGSEQQPALAAQLAQLKGRLAVEARACFAELSESLGREAAKGVPADATTHPLTASTLAYLKRILGCDTALPVLFGGDGAGPAAAGSLAEEARLLERASAAVGALLDALLAVLDAKAKSAYKQRAQAALHALNNAAHVAHALEGGSRQLRAAGEAWLERRKGLVSELQRAYMEAAWGPLLALLQQDARQAVPPNLSSDRAARQAAKDKWAIVNKALSEAAVQQGWAIPDAALRERVREAVIQALVPLYESFYNKWHTAAYTDHHAKHERVSVSELQGSLLGELFEADPGAGAGGASMVGRSPSRSPGSATGAASMVMRKLSSSGRSPNYN